MQYWSGGHFDTDVETYPVLTVSRAPCKQSLEVTFRENWVKGSVGVGLLPNGNETPLRESSGFWVC